jgi:hypothetical protein
MGMAQRFLGISRFNDRLKTLALFLVLVSPFFLGRM